MLFQKKPDSRLGTKGGAE